MTTRGEARSLMGYSETEKVIGFVGRLSPQKNPVRLVDAFEKSAKQAPHLHLAVVGGGALMKDLKARANFLKINHRIKTWEGWEARLFIAGFDALICSSDYEGLPLVFIEALQAGVPIITTPVAGARECVIEGKTGFIAEDMTVDALSAALDHYVSMDSSAQKEMSAAALRKGDFFTALRMARQMTELYRHVLERA
jgi:glycosyltransferase involved in cell wall biosynthesis